MNSPLISIQENSLHLGDCLEIMPNIADGTVDLILCNLPYGTTRNKWDSVIDLDKLWSEYKRVIKPNGAIVLTSAQPFTSTLVVSNLSMFKYELIWAKTIGSGQLNIKIQPLRIHESILVFYAKQPTYNSQMTEGVPYHAKRKSTFEGPGYNKQAPSETINTGTRHPTTVLNFSNPRIKGGHPTQKPVSLFEYLIKTYTNEGDVVLDNAIGSGTTAIAALGTNRKYIGIENDPIYYAKTKERIADFQRSLEDLPQI